MQILGVAGLGGRKAGAGDSQAGLSRARPQDTGWSHACDRRWEARLCIDRTLADDTREGDEQDERGVLRSIKRFFGLR